MTIDRTPLSPAAGMLVEIGMHGYKYRLVRYENDPSSLNYGNWECVQESGPQESVGSIQFISKALVSEAVDCRGDDVGSPETAAEAAGKIMVAIIRLECDETQTEAIGGELAELLARPPQRWNLDAVLKFTIGKLFAAPKINGRAVGFSLSGTSEQEISELIDYVHARVRPGMKHMRRNAPSGPPVVITHVLAGERNFVANQAGVSSS